LLLLLLFSTLRQTFGKFSLFALMLRGPKLLLLLRAELKFAG
jgi:hypothetical protein